MCCCGRFCAFIEAKEKAAFERHKGKKIQLPPEAIREIAEQFGTDLNSIEELSAMRKHMSRNEFADCANAIGYLQILQIGFARGEIEKRDDGLWRQAIVKRCVACAGSTK